MTGKQPTPQELVYELVSHIPAGKVLTYGQIALETGVKNPRHVGRYLHHNPDPTTIPCHRVVNVKGELSGAFAFGGPETQRKLLESEGVTFLNGRVNLKKHLWK